MVESKMLKQLGWSDELIEEVTRTSEQIERSAAKVRSIGSPETYVSAAASTSLEVSPGITTSTSLFFKPGKE
jgi:CRISPR/Cas system-associated protein Cas5 (RAMP superfamily)